MLSMEFVIRKGILGIEPAVPESLKENQSLKGNNDIKGDSANLKYNGGIKDC